MNLKRRLTSFSIRTKIWSWAVASVLKLSTEGPTRWAPNLCLSPVCDNINAKCDWGWWEHSLPERVYLLHCILEFIATELKLSSCRDLIRSCMSKAAGGRGTVGGSRKKKHHSHARSREPYYTVILQHTRGTKQNIFLFKHSI